MNSLPAALQRLMRNPGSDTVCSEVAAELSGIGKRLINDPDERIALNFLEVEDELRSAWTLIARSLDVHTISPEDASEDSILAVAVSLARLCRNALAGVEQPKAVIMSFEPVIREVAYRITSYDRIDEPRWFPLQRAIYQLLANLMAPIAGSEATPGVDQLWNAYTDGARENNIVSRALDSKDSQVNMATLVMILHATIRYLTRSSPTITDSGTSIARTMFVDRPAGPGLMIKLMDMMTVWFEAGEGTKEHECFDLGYQVTSKILDHGGHGDLYRVLGSSTSPVTSAQVTFLKLLDAWVEAGNLDRWGTTPTELITTSTSFHFLVTAELTYSRHAVPAMQELIPVSSSESTKSALGEPLLPQVLQASILATQAMINLSLREIRLDDEAARKTNALVVPCQPLIEHMRGAKSRDEGFLEVLVGYLRALETFIPRVKPFRPPPKSTAGLPTPFSPEKPQETAFLPFATLKRDLVQLIGILVNESESMQDRTRECGGVELILSMCVTDEANPYIREHALFAVRNLMTGNLGNQARIAEMEPLGMVGEDGELREMPERMGAKKAQARPDT